MAPNKENEKLLHIVFAGLFAALTALMTAALHIPVGSGYIHCGDAVIFLAAAVLPMPYAVGSAAVGGMFADLLSGYPAYALPTFLIKGLLALTFSAAGGSRKIGKKCVLALILCGAVSVLGYWIAAVVLYGGWKAQFIATVPGNCIQAAASGVLYAVIAAALERMQHPGLKML